GLQAPHDPPQPSSPHVLPAQFGVQQNGSGLPQHGSGLPGHAAEARRISTRTGGLAGGTAESLGTESFCGPRPSQQRRGPRQLTTTRLRNVPIPDLLEAGFRTAFTIVGRFVSSRRVQAMCYLPPSLQECAIAWTGAAM